MDPRDVVVFLDGRRVDGAEARVSVFDRGFLYGDSVFETLRTYAGRPFALSEHVARLRESAERVLLELPLSTDELELELRTSLELGRRELSAEECYARLMVTRGSGALGLDPGHAEKPLRVLLVARLERPPASFYEDGIAVIGFATSRHTDATPAAGAKIGNYLVAVLATAQARKAGAQEALIVDGSGHVSEGSTSNVFWIQGGTLWTPPLSAGILAGITRQHVLELAGELGQNLDHRLPRLEELQAVDEVFISSSIRELVPVVKIDGRPVADGRPGPLTRRFLEAFRERARAKALSAGSGDLRSPDRA